MPLRTDNGAPASIPRLWAWIMLPVAVALGALVWLQLLAPVPAVIAGGGIGSVVLVVIWRYLGNFWKATQYLEHLGQQPEDATPPDLDSILVGPALQGAVKRVHRAWLDQADTAIGQESLIAAIINALPHPLLLLDGNLSVVRANDAAAEMLGRQPTGSELVRLIRAPEVIDAVNMVVEDGQMAWAEYQHGGTVDAIFLVHAAPLSRPTPGGAEVLLLLEDVTATRRSERLRVDFIANASHEIRTPLTAVRGMVETLRGAAREDAAARDRFLGIMAEQVERLHTLVEDLMSLSRIELKEHTAPSEEVDLFDVLDRVQQTLTWSAERKGMEIVLDIGDGLPQVRGDDGEIERLVNNLVTNAIKYGDANTAINVSAWLETRPSRVPGWRGSGPAVAVRVRDTGPGIAREHIPRLTERFYRVDDARSRKLGGTGLGLAIVKHITQRHRGALSIDSTVGNGSEFTVYLPVAESAPAAQTVPSSTSSHAAQ